MQFDVLTGSCKGMLLCVLVLLLPDTGLALEMVRRNVEGVGEVLVLQDCERARCEAYENQVSYGDAGRLRRQLDSARVAEVWLNSKGGDSREGQEIGRVLRQYRMAVRIRSGHSCASACTVAFLGGVIRTVDEGGHYKVHARSAVRNELADDQMARLLAHPDGELEKYVFDQRREARQFVGDRLMYLQTMLGGAPNGARYAALAGEGLHLRPAYLDSPAYAADVAQIRVEGRAAAHSVIMALERASFDEALGNLQQRTGELGPRAAAAWRMMDTMFSTAIIRTADLTPEVLVKLGFVTPILGASKP